MRERWSLLVVLLAVGLVLAGSSQVWVHATSDDAVLGTTTVEVTGGSGAPAAAAAALLAGAAVLAGLVGSPAARVAAAGALVLAGLVGGWAALGVVRDPAATASAALAERTAVSGGGAGVVGLASASPWAWVALPAFAVVLLVGVLLLVRHVRPDPAGPPSRRPLARDGGGGDPARTPRAGTGTVAPEGAWERLSRGEDPTDDEHTGSGDHDRP